MSATEDARRQQALANEARRRGIPEWQLEMANAVGTDLLRDLVADSKRNSQPSSMIAKPKIDEAPRGSWGTGSVPLAQPPGVDLIDRMVATQDKLNAAQKVQELASLIAVSQRAKKMP
jgi:hypothetical protein